MAIGVMVGVVVVCHCMLCFAWGWFDQVEEN
jgi:hypothetical protein